MQHCSRSDSGSCFCKSCTRVGCSQSL